MVFHARPWTSISWSLGGAPGTPTVDVLLQHALDFDRAFEHALVQEVENVPVRIASLEDMISLKQNTGRRQDEDDIEHLLRIKDQKP